MDKKIRVGGLQKKLLILLVGGLSIALSGSPKKQFRVIKQMSREWEKVNKQSIVRAIRLLYQSKLIGYKELDGSVEITLNESGKKKALSYKVNDMKIKIPKKWDQKWRIVIFDIPESIKKARVALRFHLNRLGFYKLQKSVFVLPYDCSNEIEFLIELYNIRPYVRQIIADSIDNDFHIKQIFKIS